MQPPRIILAILAALCLAATAAAQTVKSLGYNTTNGYIVYSGTNALTFTNGISFSTNAAATTRTNLGLGSDELVHFAELVIRLGEDPANTWMAVDPTEVALGVPLVFAFTNQTINAATTRTNLGLGSGITTNITFVDASTNTNSVTISNGIITGWTQ